MFMILKDIKIKEIKLKILNYSVCKLLWMIHINIKIIKKEKIKV